MDQQLTLNGGSEDREPDKNAKFLAGFDDFWKAYPYHPSRKSALSDCKRKWRSRGLYKIPEMVMAKLAECKKTVDWREGYFPKPYNWLRLTTFDPPAKPRPDKVAESLRRERQEYEPVNPAVKELHFQRMKAALKRKPL